MPYNQNSLESASALFTGPLRVEVGVNVNDILSGLQTLKNQYIIEKDALEIMFQKQKDEYRQKIEKMQMSLSALALCEEWQSQNLKDEYRQQIEKMQMSLSALCEEWQSQNLIGDISFDQ
jgi:hypothetical protein